MQVGACERDVAQVSPVGVVECLGSSEIEGERRDNLPSEVEQDSSSASVEGGCGERIEDVRLVDIDTVVPLPHVESHQPQREADGGVGKGVADVLQYCETESRWGGGVVAVGGGECPGDVGVELGA